MKLIWSVLLFIVLWGVTVIYGKPVNGIIRLVRCMKARLFTHAVHQPSKRDHLQAYPYNSLNHANTEDYSVPVYKHYYNYQP